MARLRRNRANDNAALELPPDGMSAPRIRHLLQSDPAFQVLTIDGLNWIDPYTGTLVEAPFDWQEDAARWLLENQPWRHNTLRSREQLERHRWVNHLRGLVTDNPDFRHFDGTGQWLNPYTGTWHPGVRRDGKTLTMDSLNDMALILKDCPSATDGSPLSPYQIQQLVEAKQGNKKPPAAAPTPQAKPAHAAPSAPAAPAPLIAPSTGDQRMRIRGRPGSPGNAEPSTERVIKPSDLINGYRILSRLGTGGMSAVYRARQDGADSDVALKVLQASGERAEAFAERFILEAKAAGAVRHPNVVQVFDFGRHGERLYMTMELMPGGDAESLLVHRNKPLPERRALEIVRDATRGVVALHDAHIIHRDIKPANLFIDADGTTKVGDLGLAKQSGNQSNITIDGAAVGTPSFMSPEQARGDGILDHRVDIYALGAALFMLLTGRPPFIGGNVFTVVRKVMTEPVPDPRTFNRAVRPQTAALIAKATSKDPDDRYADAKRLLRELDALLDDCPDSEPDLVRDGSGTAAIRSRLAEDRSTDSFQRQQAAGRPTSGSDLDALEHVNDPLARLHRMGIDLGLFEARGDGADHHALRLLGKRPILLLIHTANIEAELRAEVAAGLDSIIDALVATAPDSVGQMLDQFHGHLTQFGLPPLAAIALMLNRDGDQACVSCAGMTPPLRFDLQPDRVRCEQFAYRDACLGSEQRRSQEVWVDLPEQGGLVISSPGALTVTDPTGVPFALGNVIGSVLLSGASSAQACADALGGDVDNHCQGQIAADVTFLVVSRAAKA